MKCNVIWIDEELDSEEYKKYSEELYSFGSLIVRLFKNLDKAIEHMKYIEFQETKVIVSGKLYPEFVTKFKENIIDMKKLYSIIVMLILAQYSFAQNEGWPANYGGVMLQGFYWDSFEDTQWKKLTEQADELSKYFDLIWVPNAGNCRAGNSMGYLPVYWFQNYNSSFGTKADLLKIGGGKELA